MEFLNKLKLATTTYRKQGHIIQAIFCDCETSFVAADLVSDVRFHFSPPHTHQKKCERYIQVIKERYVIINSTLLDHGVGKLPYVLLGYLFQHIVDCLNLTPGTVTAPHTPSFLFSGNLCQHDLLQQSNAEFLQPVLVRNHSEDQNPNSIAFFLGRSASTLNSATVWVPGGTVLTRQLEKKLHWDEDILRLYHRECTHIHCAQTQWASNEVINNVPECPQFAIPDTDPAEPNSSQPTIEEIPEDAQSPTIPVPLHDNQSTDTNMSCDDNVATDSSLPQDGVPDTVPVTRRSERIAQQQVADVSLGKALKMWPSVPVHAAIIKELTNLAVNLASWQYIHRITELSQKQ